MACWFVSAPYNVLEGRWSQRLLCAQDIKPAKPPPHPSDLAAASVSAFFSSITHFQVLEKTVDTSATRRIPMSHYHTGVPAAPPWSASMSMQASIVLDQPGNISFTNLDEISGRVVVRCSKSVDISTIVVKLEGESRTRLMSSPGPDGERAKPQLEYHKVSHRLARQCSFNPNSLRSSTECRWCSRLPTYLKADLGRHPVKDRILCRLGRTNIPGSSRLVEQSQFL